jgi:hypothetical protein
MKLLSPVLFQADQESTTGDLQVACGTWIIFVGPSLNFGKQDLEET